MKVQRRPSRADGRSQRRVRRPAEALFYEPLASQLSKFALRGLHRDRRSNSEDVHRIHLTPSNVNELISNSEL